MVVWVVLGLASLGIVGAAAFPPVLCAYPAADGTLLTMGEVNKRIELFSLKAGQPSAEQGLRAVYGDKEIPKDAWGNDFVYVPPAGEGLSFDLISYGADGKPGGTRHDADIAWSEIK